MDPDLQTSGKRRLKEQLPHLTKKISFENASFHKNYRPIKEGSVLSLHSCGDLTVEAMDYALKNNSALINFGCCYHKLTKLNLSTSSKSSPLEFSFKALTLATRSHRILSLEDARRRTKVKRYRYGFHILSHEDGHRTFVPLGNARHQDYEGEFKDYCAKYSPWALKGDINRRFAELENSKALQQYLLTETIRGPLGRLVEVYIALDRALYLKEFGVRVKVGTLFDRALSPRNIMIQIDV